MPVLLLVRADADQAGRCQLMMFGDRSIYMGYGDVSTVIHNSVFDGVACPVPVRMRVVDSCMYRLGRAIVMSFLDGGLTTSFSYHQVRVLTQYFSNLSGHFCISVPSIARSICVYYCGHESLGDAGWKTFLSAVERIDDCFYSGQRKQDNASVRT
ncbi:uncharacterized protein EI90DRAFT_1604658 [Cantharellus anzutake]|uniref:uncharacterized protein n=1 Tax=Cantharellus anzutake TaxID=1750568 RepID=UPI00190896A9|nr:uncharacterized protein EI90DRAFT_1604658 [Cantharellus anzutake]KAF8328125.1 hypothetical protein EI90DRAFT_1604658 [Cantharellus anzutake]